jgi:preprotein translocase subunit SecG
MSLLIGFLTFILVLNCLFLMLLVLVQLPKKEAGAGLAFGAGAVDTLIGAGSGNALTKMTKYSAASFLGLAIVLAVLNSQRSQSGSRSLDQELSRKASSAPVLNVPPQQSAPSGTLTPPADATPQPAPGGIQPLPQSTPPAAVENTTPPANIPAPANTPAPGNTPE